MTAVELLPPAKAVHGNDRWYELRRHGVTASEIAIVLGISPYGSPFSLFWQKANDWRDDGNEYTATGRHLEDAIARWFAYQHLDHWELRSAGLYAHQERPWQLATPDRICYSSHWVPASEATFYQEPDDWDGLQALLECKWVAYSWDGWGEPGSDDIPVYYRAQALWQLDVLGVDDVYVAALGPGGFRSYGPIRRDEKDLRIMRAAGQAFMHRLEAGEPPDLDGHSATLRALKRLHPSVQDRDVDTPVEFAEGWRRARAVKHRAEKLCDLYEARARLMLGDGRRLMCNRRLVASRSVYERKPYEVGPATIDKLNPGRADTYA